MSLACIEIIFMMNLSALSQKFGDIKDVVNALDEVEPLDDKMIPSDAFERELSVTAPFPTNFTFKFTNAPFKYDTIS